MRPSCTPLRLFLVLFASLTLFSPPAVQAQSVSGFVLVDADADRDLQPLTDGAKLDLAALPRHLNVRAETSPSTVGSVRFRLNGQDVQTENAAPYALRGDRNGDYNAWRPQPGTYTLEATPYARRGAGGEAGTPLTVAFSVVENGGSAPPAEPPTVDPPEEPAPSNGRFAVEGEQKRWHPITITFDGPQASEGDAFNPFLNYRLDVTFRHGGSGRTSVVSGYFAADGDAAETGATSGSKWRVHFVPTETGAWTFRASFRKGAGVAVAQSANAGTSAGFDGAGGSFSVGETDKGGRDFRGKGLLRHRGGRYLSFDNGETFLKGGADSPENFLAYEDFDGTYNAGGKDYVKSYAPHVPDWRPGDPTWKNGKGKGIIGALNYLASEGMNSVYFLTMNVEGDGEDVWPWTRPDVRDRYDVSKLAQWERVFGHMDRRGIMLHVVTQETENDQLLDGGGLGRQRRLYYRELVARFAHHLAITWNLGEENTNLDKERKAYASYLRDLDPYDHPIVIHTYPSARDKVYPKLLGFADFDGPSLQIKDMKDVHAVTRQWITRSEEAGRPWFVSLDEIGPAGTGVAPDGEGSNRDDVRKWALWGNLMAGGAGAEWYFGYRHAHHDLSAEDWRSRDRMWDETRHALTFFQEHLPFPEMTSADGLASGADAHVLAKPGEAYAVYLPAGGAARLDVRQGAYTVRWYNPRTGGALRQGSVSTVRGAGAVSLGRPPAETSKDWVALVRRADGGATPEDPEPTNPEPTDPAPGGTCRDETVEARGLPLSLYRKPVGARRFATFGLDVQGVEAARLVVTAKGIDRPEEATLKVNGQTVPLPADVVGGGRDVRTGSVAVDPSRLRGGKNRVAFTLASDLGRARGYKVTGLALTLTRCGGAAAKADPPMLAKSLDVPGAFALAQNHPNPFNPTTQIAFTLPVSADVTLRVYDVQGRAVATLVDGPLGAGRHAATWDARGLPSGVYLYRIEAGRFSATRRLLLVK